MCWFGLVLGPGSVLLLFSLLVSGETHIWLGDLQVVWCLGFCLLSWLLISFCTYFIVRLEPLRFSRRVSIRFICLYQLQDRALERHRPNQRKKKYNAMISFAICANLRLLVVVSYLFFVVGPQSNSHHASHYLNLPPLCLTMQ